MNSSDMYDVVAEYTNLNKTISSWTVEWMNGKDPLDTPLCGYDMSLCPSKIRSTIPFWKARSCVFPSYYLAIIFHILFGLRTPLDDFSPPWADIALVCVSEPKGRARGSWSRNLDNNPNCSLITIVELSIHSSDEPKFTNYQLGLYCCLQISVYLLIKIYLSTPRFISRLVDIALLLRKIG